MDNSLAPWVMCAGANAFVDVGGFEVGKEAVSVGCGTSACN